MDYFISDTHFNHAKIIDYCSRPFTDAEAMDNSIISCWNSIIKPKDRVFHLGDFALATKTEIANYITKLNGRIYLILGNHDRYEVREYRELGFKDAFDYPIIYNNFYMLSHEPLFVGSNMPYYNIHGHIHENSMSLLTHYNVSVENINYKPQTLAQILQQRDRYKDTYGR